MLTPTTAYYATAINRPHQPIFRIQVLDGKGNPLGEIKHLDGSVSTTLNSQVTRTAELLIDPALTPTGPSDLLYPNGNRLFIERGISYGCGEEVDLFPVFHGRINSVIDNPRGPTRIRAVDLAGDIRDASFTVPTNSLPGNSILDEFKRLVSDALPSATFGTSDTFAAAIGTQTWDTDRAQALDDMANAVAAFWYTLGNGDFVMRRVPWTIPQTPLLMLFDGLPSSLCAADETPAGLPILSVSDSSRERSREQVQNVITVAAERTDGSPPIVYVAADNDPASPTWIGGNYGIKNRHVRTDVALIPAQVKLMADATLKRAKALTDTWAIKTVADARIELGDCVLVACNRVTSLQVVASIRMPLTVQGSMDLSTRALLPSDLAVIA